MLFFGEGFLAVPVKEKSDEAVPPFIFIKMKQVYHKCFVLCILSFIGTKAIAKDYDCIVDGIIS